MPWCITRQGDLLLRLTVQPRSAREGFEGERAGRLCLRVASPPVDDAANERVIELVAARAGVPRRAVSILRGAHSRSKDVLVRSGGACWRQFAAIDGGSGPAAAPTAGAHAASPARKP